MEIKTKAPQSGETLSVPRLSVFIIVKNEEKNIERCLRSVRWADEIVVVDSFSTDRTVEFCRAYTGSLHTHAFQDYADQKNFAMSLTKGPWLLSIDADEEVTPELKGQILDVMARPAAEAYRIPRTSYIFSRKFRFSGTQDDRPIRLFRKGHARFVQPVHEKVEIEGKILSLSAPLNHYTYPSVSDYLTRFNRYTSMEAAGLKAAGKRAGFTDIWLKPWGRFLQLYVWKQGIRDGVEGLAFSLFSAFYVLIKYLKCAELERQS